MIVYFILFYLYYRLVLSPSSSRNHGVPIFMSSSSLSSSFFLSKKRRSITDVQPRSTSNIIRIILYTLFLHSILHIFAIPSYFDSIGSVSAAAAIEYNINDICDNYSNDTLTPVCLITTGHTLNCTNPNGTQPIPSDWPFTNPSDIPPLDICMLNINISINFTEGSSLTCTRPTLCQLIFNVNGTLVVGSSSIVRANTIHMYASDSIFIEQSGIVTSSELGLLFGSLPGDLGNGGTYAGVGGQDQCFRHEEKLHILEQNITKQNLYLQAYQKQRLRSLSSSTIPTTKATDTSPNNPSSLTYNRDGVQVTTCCVSESYYLSTNVSIGSITAPEMNWNLALGSGGGGFPGEYGGRSGGRINITTPVLYLEGTISADGEISSAVTFAGSGSGGTVVINAVNIQPGPSYAGTISAMGGLATRASFGGGGGGRIVLRFTTFNLPFNNIYAGGGGFQLPDEKPECWVGSAGTVFLSQSIDPVQNISFNTLRIFNGNNFGYAVTPLNIYYIVPDDNSSETNSSNPIAPDDTVGMDLLTIAGGSVVASTYLNMRRLFSAMTSPPPPNEIAKYSVEKYGEEYYASYQLPLRERLAYQYDLLQNISNEYSRDNNELNNHPTNSSLGTVFSQSIRSNEEDVRNLPLPVFSTVGITLSRASLFPLVGVGLNINTSELVLGDRAYIDAANLLLYIICSNISQAVTSEIFSFADIVITADHTVDLEGDIYYEIGPLNKPKDQFNMNALQTKDKRNRRRSLANLDAAPLDALVGIRAGQVLYIGSDADISVTRLLMYTPGNITIGGRVETVDTSPSLCTEILSSREICLQLHWGDDRPYPPTSSYTLVLDAPYGLIEIITNGRVSPQIGIFCAEIIKIDTGAAIAGNGQGCSSDEGWGAGLPSSGGAGSGAGHAGTGGVSSQGAIGGSSYDNPVYPLYPGSGGGSAEGNGGLGGAYLVLAGQQIVDIVFGSLVSVDGENGGYGGGGSGGAILVETFRFTGGGYLSLNGGDGNVGGGGGSGGIFRLRSALLPEPTKIEAGNESVPSSVSLPLPPKLGDIASTFSGIITFRGGAGTQGGGQGANGTVMAPPCPPGSQLNTVQAKCVSCGPGYWRNGSSIGQSTCARCTNAPPKGLYTDPQSTVSDCTYVCPPGTLYPSCDTPLEQLVNLFGGEAGFEGSIGGVMACLLIFLLYCLRKRVLVVQNLKKTETLNISSSVLGNWGIGNQRGNNNKSWNGKSFGNEYQSNLLDTNGRKGSNNYGSSTSKTGNNRFGIYSGSSGSNFNASPSSSSGVGTADRLAFALSLLRGSGDSFGNNPAEFKRMRNVASTLSDPTTLNFLISGCAMQEADLPRHATRIYLGGSNAFGSSWRLPWDADRKLRKHVRSRPYANFAETVNELLQWPRWGWEEIVYMLLTIAAYPFAYSFLRARRRYRSVLLMQYVLGRENSHKWLKGTKAHALQNGLRIGVSADFTLAYIDVLHTETNTLLNGKNSGKHNSKSDSSLSSGSVPRSLSVPSTANGKNISVHTPRLPIGLLFAGDGSFEKPFYLDANDVLVRSVPSVPGLSRFIDADWLEFIAEMNARTRCIAAGAIVQTIGPLLSFIAAVNADPELLGGLRIEIVRYWPCAPSFIDPTVDNEDSSTTLRTTTVGSETNVSDINSSGYPALSRNGSAKDDLGKLSRKPSNLNTQRPPTVDPEGGTTTEDELTSHSGSENHSRRDSFNSTQSSNKEDEVDTVVVMNDTKSSLPSLKIKINKDNSETKVPLSPTGTDSRSKTPRNGGTSIGKPITVETTFERLGFGVDSDEDTTDQTNKPRTAPSTNRSVKDTGSLTYSSLQNEETLNRFDSFLPREFSGGGSKLSAKTIDNDDEESVYGDDQGNDGPASNRGRQWWTSMTSLADDVVSIADARLGLLVTMQGLSSPLSISNKSPSTPSPLYSFTPSVTDGNTYGSNGGGRTTNNKSSTSTNGASKVAYDPVPNRSTTTTLTDSRNNGNNNYNNSNTQNYLTTNNLHSLDDFDTFQFTIGDDGVGGVGKPIVSTSVAPTTASLTDNVVGSTKNVSHLRTLPYPSSTNPKVTPSLPPSATLSLSNHSEGPLVTSHLSAYMANGAFSADPTDGDPDAVLCSSNESVNCITTTVSDIIGTNYIDIGGDYDVIGKRINLHLPYPGVIMKPLRKKDLVYLYWTAAGWFPTLPGIPASPNWHDMDALFTASQYYMHQQQEQRDAQNIEFMVDNKKLGGGTPGNDPSLPMDAGRANRYQRNLSRGNNRNSKAANDLFGTESDFVKRVIVSATRLAYECRAEEYRRKYRFPPPPSSLSLSRNNGLYGRNPNTNSISNWYTDTERGFGQNNGGLIIGNHSRPKLSSNNSNNSYNNGSYPSRFTSAVPSSSGTDFSSSYQHGQRDYDDHDSVHSHGSDSDQPEEDETIDEHDSRFAGYSNHYQYWNESSSSSWFTSPYNAVSSRSRSSTSAASLAVPAPPQWFWSAGITPWNVCKRIRNPQYDPHHNFISQNIIGTFLWKFSFVFCRCLRRSTTPLPQHRNWLYFLVVFLHIALIIIEISMTMILVAQLWCIEPTTDIGTDSASSSSIGGVKGNNNNNPLGFTDLLIVGECSFSALVVYLAAPPLTCILPPLLGLAAVASGSSRGLRIYSAWNGFSIWSTLVALAVVVSNLTQLGNLTLIFPFLLLFLKFSAAQLVPIQLVAIETARPVRGWRGLFEVRTGPIEKSRRMELQQYKTRGKI